MTENAEVVDVTGLTQNPKALRKLLMARIRAQGGTTAVDSKAIVQGLIKQTLEAFLELEMEGHLGYPQYAAEGSGSGNSRNGSTSKTVRGDFGEVEIERRGTATTTSIPGSSPSGRHRSATSPKWWFRSTPVA